MPGVLIRDNMVLIRISYMFHGQRWVHHSFQFIIDPTAYYKIYSNKFTSLHPTSTLECAFVLSVKLECSSLIKFVPTCTLRSPYCGQLFGVPCTLPKLRVQTPWWCSHKCNHLEDADHPLISQARGYNNGHLSSLCESSFTKSFTK